MADAATSAQSPRIERLTIWAIALDVVAVASFFVVSDVFAEALNGAYSQGLEVAFYVSAGVVPPLATITALALSRFSARRAIRRSAKGAARGTVMVSSVLLVLSLAYLLLLLMLTD